MAADQFREETTPSILVVDDDEVSLALIAMMFEAEGCQTLQAAGGEQALKVASGLKQDTGAWIVLADQQMPGLCGRELALPLRALLPQAMLIAMSATPSEAQGYDAFLIKPLDFHALRALARGKRLNISGSMVDIYAAETESIPALDERVYLKLQRMMTPAKLTEVYEVCLQDVRNRARKMQELAIASELDSAAVRASAHAIKGGAGMIGASCLARAAEQLETESYQKDDLPILANKLLFCCDQLQSILLTKSKLAV